MGGVDALASLKVEPVEAGPIAVFAAMRGEIAPLLRGMRVVESTRIGRCRVWRGTLEGSAVVLAVTGEGKTSALEGAAAVLERHPARRILVLGVAGGLAPGLEPGAVVVAREIVDGRRRAPRPDVDWAHGVVADESVLEGMALTTDRVLCTAESKAAAWVALGASEPATVDMESSAFAAVASRQGIPFTVIRAVSDTATECLPFDLNRCIDAEGRIRRARVVGQALRHPESVADLWRLHRRVALCADRLASVARRLLREAIE